MFFFPGISCFVSIICALHETVSGGDSSKSSLGALSAFDFVIFGCWFTQATLELYEGKH